MASEKLYEHYGNNCIGQILRIISSDIIIVSATNQDLKVGNEIIVYSVGDSIFDLDGNELCKYEYFKERLKVIETTDHYSVCQTDIPSNYPQVFDISPIITTKGHKPLNVNSKEIEPLLAIDKKIHKGDPIKLA